jgi:hypothetical protein
MNVERGIGGNRVRVALTMASVLGAVGIGTVLAGTPAGGRGAATTRTATTRTATASAPAARTVTAADRKAADDEFDKATALFKQGHYAEARAANEKALALDPAHFNALLLRQVLEDKLAGGGDSGAGTGGRSSAGGAAGAAPGKVSLLSAQQMTLIRAMEANPADRLTGKFDAKVLEDFWNTVVVKDQQADKSKAAHDAFVSPTNFPLQLARIKAANDLKYFQGATISTDPAVIKAFTGSGGVNPYVMTNCATAECHAGKNGGNFRLVNPTNNPEAQYTNFYILSMYSNGDGKMIDRDNPEKSLLLQYSLPYAVAAVKHPKVDIRKLSGLNDPRLRSMTDWIKSLAFPKPNFGIVYDMPGMSAPATPATAPAKTPPK